MTHRLIALLTILISFSLLTSCGGDNGGNGGSEPTVEEEETTSNGSENETGSNGQLDDPDFEGNLEEHNATIKGKRCEGNEEVNGNNCNRDEWIIEVEKNDNRERFIAKLIEEDVISIPEYSFYRIEPQESISSSIQEIIEDAWVRKDLNGPTTVVPRDSESV